MRGSRNSNENKILFPARAVINGSWKKPSVSEHFAPFFWQSAVPSPHIAILRGRNAGWTSRIWCSTGSWTLSHFPLCHSSAVSAEFPGHGLLNVHLCSSHRGKYAPDVYPLASSSLPSHCWDAPVTSLTRYHSGRAAAYIPCLVTTPEHHLFTLSSPKAALSSP